MKLTTTVLKKIIAEEVAKFQEAKSMSGFGEMVSTEEVADDAKEVDAKDLAGSLENHIDHYKALGLEETRLLNRLAKIHETKRRISRKLSK